MTIEERKQRILAKIEEMKAEERAAVLDELNTAYQEGVESA